MIEDPIDDPLPATTQDHVENTFTAYYKFPVDPMYVVADCILERNQREFLRHQPSMLTVAKVRPVTTCQRTAIGKRHRLGDLTLILEGGRADLYGKGESRLRFRLPQYKVLRDTWALVGCFVYPINAGPDSLCCQWEGFHCLSLIVGVKKSVAAHG